MSLVSGYANLDALSGILPTSSTGKFLGGKTQIDLETIANHNIYTVKTGQYVIVQNAFLIITSADTVTQVPDVSLGKSGGYSELLPVSTLTAFDSANYYMDLMKLTPSQIGTIFLPGDTIGMAVTSGATAGTMIGTLLLYGIIL